MTSMTTQNDQSSFTTKLPLDRRSLKCLSILEKIAAQVGGAVRHSMGGVPHLVVTLGETTYSVTYFSSRRTLRVFSPYPGSSQTRHDFKQWPEVVTHLRAQNTTATTA